MKPVFKSITTETSILIFVFIAVWVITFILTGKHHFLKPTLDIELHDTYFVLAWQTIVVEPFLIIITLIYLIKEGIYKYKRKIQNFILIISNFIFIVLLSTNFVIFGVFEAGGGWQVCPPLSALPNEKPLLAVTNRFNQIEHVVFMVLIFFLLILVLSAIHTGKNWRAKNHETQV